MTIGGIIGAVMIAIPMIFFLIAIIGEEMRTYRNTSKDEYQFMPDVDRFLFMIITLFATLAVGIVLFYGG